MSLTVPAAVGGSALGGARHRGAWSKMRQAAGGRQQHESSRVSVAAGRQETSKEPGNTTKKARQGKAKAKAASKEPGNPTKKKAATTGLKK